MKSQDDLGEKRLLQHNESCFLHILTNQPVPRIASTFLLTIYYLATDQLLYSYP